MNVIKFQEDVVKLVAKFAAIEAIGVSGSVAREATDKLSDIDLCVYVAGEIPSAKERERAYTSIGFSDVIYYDVGFETSRGDGYWRAGIRYDFNWMSIGLVKAYLKKLETDFDSLEYVPGGLEIVKPLHDPAGIITKLQAEIPWYSDERAKYRIKRNLEKVHFSLYGLGWLEKAVFRQDTYLFLKYENVALDTLFRVLYALNKEWLCDEKGLVRKISNFPNLPEQFASRVISLIMHQDENANLCQSLFNLKKLLADTVLIVEERYSDLELPHNWE